MTQTPVDYITTEAVNEYSKICSRCYIYFYIKKNFQRNNNICDICYKVLDNKQRESGTLFTAYTENQKFHTNTYKTSAQIVFPEEDPKAICSFLDLKHMNIRVYIL